MIPIKNIGFTNIPTKNIPHKNSKKVSFYYLHHNFYLCAERELQQGISVSQEIVSKIEACMQNILQKKEGNGLKLYHSQEINRVFTLDLAPELIFKLKIPGSTQTMKARYQAMIHAQTIIHMHQLGLLVIPNARLFVLQVEEKEYEIIAERKLDVNSDEDIQEHYFHIFSDTLTQAINQLAKFIICSGYSDVTWRNNPVLHNSLDTCGNRKIALIDLEENDGAEAGLFGGLARGLVGCTNEVQAKSIALIAHHHGFSMQLFASAFFRRRNELIEGHLLSQFYAKKGITLGNELIQIGEDLLTSFDLQEKKLVYTIIHIINEQISLLNSELPKIRRYVYITSPFEVSAKIEAILKKLVELEVIFKIVKKDIGSYFIQA
ncbi:hypothetical protein [Parachlamydia acanthamoebae]|nr:hypothetical protein [Parachlamydia acanthamoebae]